MKIGYDIDVMNIFRNSIIAFLALSITGLMVFWSFVFGTAPTIAIADKSDSIAYFSTKVTTAWTSSAIVKTPSGKIPPATIEKWSALQVDFGRLASALFLPTAGKIPTNILTASGKDITISSLSPSIVSLYDPFSLYTIYSDDKSYSIAELTNGSFYIGRETDGTISLYSIDVVARLSFLDQSKVMTDMVVFPGMYVRFDPKLNKTLNGVNLFRLSQSLASDSEETNLARTGIEFVNPRMNNTDEKDTFFMYRLPKDTRTLFRILHVMFYDRVEQVNLIKKYANDTQFQSTNNSAWMINPTKKNALLMRELQSVLSQGLQTRIDTATFSRQITDINTRARDLTGVEGTTSVADTIDQFLTDARFALFAGTANDKYADIYNAAATIRGISPRDDQYKLFQKLSDIYSRNLVTQKQKLNYSKIDTYSPTARELALTIDANIPKKDYFDIALYAFNILGKTEEQRRFIPEYLDINSTYELMSTIFNATEQYIGSIDDAEQKKKAYKSFSIHFYDHILSVLTNSLYDHFTTTDENNHLFLKWAYYSDDAIKIDDSIIADIRSLNRIIQDIVSNLTSVYSDENDSQTFASIEEAAVRLDGLVSILDTAAYQTYVITPYVAVGSGILEGGRLPVIDGVPKKLKKESATTSASTAIDPLASSDPSHAVIRKYVGNIPTSSIVKEGQFYRVTNAKLQAVRPSDRTTIDYTLSVVFATDMSTISDIIVTYNDRNIAFVFPKDAKLDPGRLVNVIGAMSGYLSRIDTLFAENASLSGEIRIFPEGGVVIIGAWYKFDL
jgi:hypothetical protein